MIVVQVFRSMKGRGNLPVKLVGMNRHSGEVVWTKTADQSFAMAAIGNGTVYCVDGVLDGLYQGADKQRRQGNPRSANPDYSSAAGRYGISGDKLWSVLNAPNFAFGCSCSYSVFTSLALIHLPDSDPYQVLPTLTRRGVEYIKAQKDTDKPFFLYFAFPCPHAPIIPNDEFDGKSKAGPYGDFVYQTDDACRHHQRVYHQRHPWQPDRRRRQGLRWFDR